MNWITGNKEHENRVIRVIHRVWQYLSICILLVTWSYVQTATASVNTLRAVDISSQTDGRTVVRVTLDKAIEAPPAGVLLSDSDRLYFDLEQIDSALDKSGKIPCKETRVHSWYKIRTV